MVRARPGQSKHAEGIDRAYGRRSGCHIKAFQQHTDSEKICDFFGKKSVKKFSKDLSFVENNKIKRVIDRSNSSNSSTYSDFDAHESEG